MSGGAGETIDTPSGPTLVSPAQTRADRRVICGPYGIVIEDARSLEDALAVVERRFPNDDPASHRRIVDTLLGSTPHPLSVMFHSLTESTLPDEPMLPLVLRSLASGVEVVAEEMAVDGRMAGAVRWYRLPDPSALLPGDSDAWAIVVGENEAPLPREWIKALTSREG